MILRRITANFRRHDWTAVIIELIVIVVGVFIGLQASNWNQERVSNQQSAEFTARLKADLREMVREGMQSHYREALRMSLPNRVQRALGEHCGDHITRPGDCAAIRGVLDYPCSTGLSSQAIAEAAKALRSNPNIVPYLRLRIADIETRLGDLTSNNSDIMEHLRTVAWEKP